MAHLALIGGQKLPTLIDEVKHILFCGPETISCEFHGATAQNDCGPHRVLQQLHTTRHTHTHTKVTNECVNTRNQDPHVNSCCVPTVNLECRQHYCLNFFVTFSKKTKYNTYLNVLDQELQKVSLLQGMEIFHVEMFGQLLLQRGQVEQGEGGVLGRHAVFDVLLDLGCETQWRKYFMTILRSTVKLEWGRKNSLCESLAPSLGRAVAGLSSVLIWSLVLEALSLGTRSCGTASEPPQMASWNRDLASRLSDTCCKKLWTCWSHRGTKVRVRNEESQKHRNSKGFFLASDLLIVGRFIFLGCTIEWWPNCQLGHLRGFSRVNYKNAQKKRK